MPSPGCTARRRSRRRRLGAPAARHRPQRDDQRRPERGVEEDEGHEGDPDAACVRDRIRGPHDVVDDPRLASDLRHDPAALERDDRGDAGDGGRAEEPARLREVPPPPPRDPEPEGKQDQQRADPDHRVERPVEHGVERGAVGGRDGIEPCHLRARAPADEERVEPGNPDPALDAARGAPAEDVLGDVGRGRLHAFHRGELDRLILGDRAGRCVTDRELDRRRDAGDRQRDQQPEAMEAVAPAAQHPDGVDRRDQEPGDEIRRQDHVRDLVGDRRVEDHLPRVDGGDLAGRRREPLRLVHPRVHRHDRIGAAEARDHDRDTRPEVRPRREVLPAEDVDRDEDRLEEEEDALDREQHPEHPAEPPRERGPQEAELEREHRAGDRSDREGHRHRLRPPLRQPQRIRVVAAQAAVVRDQHHRRKRHTE